MHNKGLTKIKESTENIHYTEGVQTRISNTTAHENFLALVTVKQVELVAALVCDIYKGTVLKFGFRKITPGPCKLQNFVSMCKPSIATWQLN